MEAQELTAKLNQLPAHLRAEVDDFIDFLLEKNRQEQGPPPSETRPVFGSAKGMFTMAPDFDEPLDDLKEYME